MDGSHGRGSVVLFFLRPKFKMVTPWSILAVEKKQNILNISEFNQESLRINDATITVIFLRYTATRNITKKTFRYAFWVNFI